jgi:hypothetical protein
LNKKSGPRLLALGPLRVKGKRFTPRVFAKGRYTIRVGEGDAVQEFKAVETVSDNSERELKVRS